MAECSYIDYRLQEDGVAVLTLDNPPLNLTTLITLDKLLAACKGIAADDASGWSTESQQRVKPCPLPSAIL